MKMIDNKEEDFFDAEGNPITIDQAMDDLGAITSADVTRAAARQYVQIVGNEIHDAKPCAMGGHPVVYGNLVPEDDGVAFSPASNRPLNAILLSMIAVLVHEADCRVSEQNKPH